VKLTFSVKVWQIIWCQEKGAAVCLHEFRRCKNGRTDRKNSLWHMAHTALAYNMLYASRGKKNGRIQRLETVAARSTKNITCMRRRMLLRDSVMIRLRAIVGPNLKRRSLSNGHGDL